MRHVNNKIFYRHDSFYCSACFSLNLCLTLLLCVLYFFPFLLHLHFSDYVNEGFSFFRFQLPDDINKGKKKQTQGLGVGTRTREIREVVFDDWMEELFHSHEHITHHSLPSEIKNNRSDIGDLWQLMFQAFSIRRRRLCTFWIILFSIVMLAQSKWKGKRRRRRNK